METIDFNIVNGQWIIDKQKKHRLTNRLLAKMVNVDEALISKYRAGQSMSGSTKAALYWSIKVLEIGS